LRRAVDFDVLQPAKVFFFDTVVSSMTELRFCDPSYS